MLCPNQIDNSCTIIGEKKRIRVELHDVARTSENFTILQKAGDEVLRTLAFAHYDYFVAVADPLVGRAVKRYKKSILDRGGCIRIAEIFKTESRAVGWEICIRAGHIAASGRTAEFRVGKDAADG